MRRSNTYVPLKGIEEPYVGFAQSTDNRSADCTIFSREILAGIRYAKKLARLLVWYDTWIVCMLPYGKRRSLVMRRSGVLYLDFVASMFLERYDRNISKYYFNATRIRLMCHVN